MKITAIPSNYDIVAALVKVKNENILEILLKMGLQMLIFVI